MFKIRLMQQNLGHIKHVIVEGDFKFAERIKTTLRILLRSQEQLNDFLQILRGITL